MLRNYTLCVTRVEKPFGPPNVILTLLIESALKNKIMIVQIHVINEQEKVLFDERHSFLFFTQDYNVVFGKIKGSFPLCPVLFYIIQ